MLSKTLELCLNVVNDKYAEEKTLKKIFLEIKNNEQILNLQKCLICNRHFTQDRLIEHERACKKSRKFHLNSLHRYHYDSQLHRWKDLDYGISTTQSNAKHKELQSLTKHFPRTHWREKHQQFQNIIKGQYNPTNDLIQLSNDRPYQCSLCQRKFATDIAITKHQKGCAGNRKIDNIKSHDIRNKNVKY
ncbi:unnamed protein product [Rotaria sp. Silwood2]|nr:unnamed protein product [Rotaria sp. Silwood2]CAF4355668.1 unnamed protein product [Rotaria sp. Silwood2]